MKKILLLIVWILININIVFWYTIYDNDCRLVNNITNVDLNRWIVNNIIKKNNIVNKLTQNSLKDLKTYCCKINKKLWTDNCKRVENNNIYPESYLLFDQLLNSFLKSLDWTFNNNDLNDVKKTERDNKIIDNNLNSTKLSTITNNYRWKQNIQNIINNTLEQNITLYTIWTTNLYTKHKLICPIIYDIYKNITNTDDNNSSNIIQKNYLLSKCYSLTNRIIRQNIYTTKSIMIEKNIEEQTKYSNSYLTNYFNYNKLFKLKDELMYLTNTFSTLVSSIEKLTTNCN